MKTFKEYLEEAHRPGHVAIAVNGNYPGVKRYTVFFRPDAKSPLGRTKAKDISHHDDLADAKKAKAEYVEKHKNHGVVALHGLNEEYLSESTNDTITTVEGRLGLRPGSKHAHKVIKEHGSYTHPVTKEEHRVFSVKQPNGFHGVLVTNKDKTQVLSSNHINLNKKEAHEKAYKHYQGTE